MNDYLDILITSADDVNDTKLVHEYTKLKEKQSALEDIATIAEIDGSLRIIQANDNDAGRYQCVVNSKANIHGLTIQQNSDIPLTSNHIIINV